MIFATFPRPRLVALFLLALLLLMWAWPREGRAGDIIWIQGCSRNYNSTTYGLNCGNSGCHVQAQEQRLRDLQDKISDAKIQIFDLEQKEIVDRRKTVINNEYTNGTNWWDERRYIPLHARIRQLKARIREWEREMKEGE